MSARLATILFAFGMAGCRYLLGDEPMADVREDAAIDGLPDADPFRDAAADAPPGFVCAGSTGMLNGVCVAPELAPVTIQTALDTDGSACMPYTPGSAYCVIAGTTIDVETTLVTGSRPLVLLATEEIRVDGALDISARGGGAQRAPGGDPAGGCNGGIPAGGGQNPETRGGAGGSFGGVGGRGGVRNGNDYSATSGVPGAAIALSPPTTLRGGCRGQNGGAGAPGGFGGGAVYLVSLERIAVTGSINASGAGGSGGGVRRGGAGGGSGGMIGLDAPAVSVTGTVFADGGGGGEGGGGQNPGEAGDDPTGRAPAAGGSLLVGGSDGGSGSFGTVVDGGNALRQNNTESGGGGGGGAGAIWIHATMPSLSGTISPPPRNI